MNKVVLNFLVIVALAVSAVFTSCNKNEGNDGKVEGKLIINDKSHTIIDGCMCERADGTVSLIVFNGKDGSVVNVVTKNIELTSKTYTANEIEVIGFVLDGEGVDFDEDNVEMVVIKSGKTYDITINGKTKGSEYEYTVTYKGKIRGEKDLCNK
jgi:hypothetical protein